MRHLKQSTRSLLLLVALGFAFPSYATPSLRHTEDFYSIQGNAVNELVQQMDLRSPWGPDGKQYYAATEWDVQWRYQFMMDNNECSFYPANVTVKVHYLYPKWTNKNSAPTELQHKWDRFYGALTKHEKGHADFARKAALDVESHIRAARGPNCSLLSEQVEEHANAIIDNTLLAEIEYDNRTNHGVADGAYLD